MLALSRAPWSDGAAAAAASTRGHIPGRPIGLLTPRGRGRTHWLRRTQEECKEIKAHDFGARRCVSAQPHRTCWRFVCSANASCGGAKCGPLDWVVVCTATTGALAHGEPTGHLAASPTREVVEEIAEHLLPEVLEGQRRAMEQLCQPHITSPPAARRWGFVSSIGQDCKARTAGEACPVRAAHPRASHPPRGTNQRSMPALYTGPLAPPTHGRTRTPSAARRKLPRANAARPHRPPVHARSCRRVASSRRSPPPSPSLLKPPPYDALLV